MVALIEVAPPGRARRTRRGPTARADPEPAGRGRPGLLRPARHQQRTHRGHQRRDSNISAGPRSGSATSPTTSKITARDRRVQIPTTPSVVKSRETSRRRVRASPLRRPQARAANRRRYLPGGRVGDRGHQHVHSSGGSRGPCPDRPTSWADAVVRQAEAPPPAGRGGPDERRAGP